MEKVDTYRKWCSADTLLLIAALIFAVSLLLEIAYPENIYFEGLHFVADAALVGAIADYFAVTAIFRHPFWGVVKIKGVTGLLPGQREKFQSGAVTLLKEELVTTKVLLRAIHKINLIDKLTAVIRDEKQQQTAVCALLAIIGDKFNEARKGKYTRDLATSLRNALQEGNSRKLIYRGLIWLKEDGNGAKFFGMIVPPLENYLRQPQFRQTLTTGYDALAKQSDDSKGLLAGIAEFFIGKSTINDIINTKELAERTQEQLVSMANKLGTKDSPLQKRVVMLVTEHGESLLNDKEFCNSVSAFRKKLLDDAPFEDVLQEIFSYIWSNFDQKDLRRSIENKAVTALRSNIAEILHEQLILIVTLLGKDEELRKSLEKFIREVATLSGMEGRDMASEIIMKNLEKKTDEDINRLVWNKFDEDLIFIRKNGTIVGAGFGLILFVIITFIEHIAF